MVNKIASLEALLYVAGDNGLDQDNLSRLLQIDRDQVEKLALKLKNKFKQDPNCGLSLIKVNHLYKLTNSPATSKLIETYFNKNLSRGLSQSALEILAIVAYRQPITRVEIDEIRGVNSVGAIQTLIWRGFIKVKGQKEAPGKPNLYVTTDYFLQYFGYHNLADLPLIENFEDESDEGEKE